MSHKKSNYQQIIFQVQAGCQQAQACYMQKYQNFVVEAGRQSWPGDAYGENHKLATRPDDMRADQWIYNIIKVCNFTWLKTVDYNNI